MISIVYSIGDQRGHGLGALGGTRQTSLGLVFSRRRQVGEEAMKHFIGVGAVALSASAPKLMFEKGRPLEAAGSLAWQVQCAGRTSSSQMRRYRAQEVVVSLLVCY